MLRHLLACCCFLLVVPSVSAQHLPEGAADWYLNVSEDVDLYVVEKGQAAAAGDTVVVLHGGWGAEHSYLWDALVPLTDRYHFVLYDQRGSLRSPAPDSTISLPRLVNDLEELRRELGLERMTLFSHSMGAQLAYAYTAEHPEHVRGLTLVAPVLPPGADVNPEKQRRARKRFVEFAASNEATELDEEGLARDSLSDREKTERWRIGFASGNIYHINRWRQMKGGQAFYNPDIARLINQNTPSSYLRGLFDALKSNDLPIRVIIGDHDLVDFGLVSWPGVARRLSNMQLITLKNAGHNAWIDQPKRFRRVLQQALQVTTR